MSVDCSICMMSYDTLERKPLNGMCGHTYCATCVDSLTNQHNGSCPYCRREESFCDLDDSDTNFALLECIETLNVVKLQNEHETAGLKQSIAALETLHDDLEVEKRKVREASEKLAAMTTVVEEFTKKLDTEKEILHSMTWMCTGCGIRVDHSRARICLDCCEGISKNDSEVAVIDLCKTDASVLCVVTVFWKDLTKIRHTASVAFDHIDSNLGETVSKKINEACNNISGVCDRFKMMISKKRAEAALQPNILDFDKFLRDTHTICTSFDGIASAFAAQSTDLLSNAELIFKGVEI